MELYNAKCFGVVVAEQFLQGLDHQVAPSFSLDPWAELQNPRLAAECAANVWLQMSRSKNLPLHLK